MHPDPALRCDDPAALRAFAAGRAFTHIFACASDGPTLVHAPVEVPPRGSLRFHLARRNDTFARLDGAQGNASMGGPDAYVSPDWYGTPDQVPTWNYIAVGRAGAIRRLPDEETPAQLVAIGTMEEAKLAPKPAWTREKIGPGRFAPMLGGVAAFELVADAWRGNAKLSQNKSAVQRDGVIAAYRPLGRHDMADLVEQVP